MKKILVFLFLILSIALLSMAIRTNPVDEELLKIAKEYRTYSLYNNENYWTLELCAPMRFPSQEGDSLHISAADPDKSPHGNKLYKLYVKDLKAYERHWEKQPEGQVLIKEVWNTRIVLDEDSVDKGKVVAKRSLIDREFYTTTTRKELYVMYKTKPSEENDEGWWYGIIDIEQGTDKAKVIESMKINRCIKCHQQNKADRIFGNPY